MATVLLASSTVTDWNSTNIWVSATLPTVGDHVYAENVTTTISTGPSGTNDVLFASLNFDASYIGLCGGSTAPLGVMATDVNIGYHYGSGSPAGSGRINLDLSGGTSHTSAGRITVFATANSPQDDDRDPVRIVTDSTYHTLEVRSGSVGVATNVAGETATLSAVEISFVESVDDDAAVNVGPGVTLSTLKQLGGDNVVQCAATTVDAQAGTLLLVGSGAYTNMHIGRAAKVYPESSGAITQMYVAGEIDMTRSNETRTVTNVALFDGCTFRADWQVVALTNGLDLTQTRLQDCTVELGRNFNIPTLVAIA